MASEPNTTPDGARTVRPHALLWARIYPETRLRLAIAILIAVGTVFGRYVLRVEDLPFTSLLALAAVIALYNLVAQVLTRRFQRPSLTPAEFRHLTHIMYGAITLDFLCLAIAIMLVGGARSPFMTFFILHISLACLLMSRREAIVFSALAYGLVMVLVLSEWLDIVPPQRPVALIGGEGPIGGRYALTVLVVYAVLFSITATLLTTLTSWLRDEEDRVAEASAELRRLSNLRRDFLHVTLHNLQSPLGAVAMQLRNIRSGLGGPTTPDQQRWLDRSLDRLGGLSSFMHDLQTLSTLESGQVRDQTGTLDLGAILDHLVEEYRERARDRGHELTLERPGTLPPVAGIEPLIREAIANFITNAIKYTPEGGRIVLRAVVRAPWVSVEVQDNGIGVAPADQQRIFQDFVRLKPEVPGLGADDGTGLGLPIVRRIAEDHGGRARVESAAGQGSVFALDLPVKSD